MRSIVCTGMAAALLSLAGLAPLPAAPIPREIRAAERELVKLRGDWTLVRTTKADGTARPSDSSYCNHFLMTFEGRKVVTEYEVGDPSLFIEETFAIEVIGTTKRIAFTVFEVSSSAIHEWKGQARHGVYELEGDRLVLCVTDYGATKWPTGFEPGEGREIHELKRVKR